MTFLLCATLLACGLPTEADSFDRTTDVAGWLAGGANAGWMIKKDDEGLTGRVDFGSRESGTAPRLMLSVAADVTPGDTLWPVITGNGPMLDTTLIVRLSDDPDASYFFRTVFIVYFHDPVTKAAKAAFFSRHGLRVVGEDRGDFYVEIDDPGPDLQNFLAILDSIRAEPETEFVLELFPMIP